MRRRSGLWGFRRVSEAAPIIQRVSPTPSESAPPVAEAAALPDRHINGHRRAYLLGIGGVGMSGAAELLAARGLEVGGSDRMVGPRTDRLTTLGIHVDAREDADLLPAGLDLLVASSAIPEDHPQLEEACRRGVEVWKYADLLGALMAEREAICVAGSHGKTTTSSLLAYALLDADRDPTFVVGGTLAATSSGARSGCGPHFVAESCEFDRTFHRHRPKTAIVLNVDEDHLDYYGDLAEIQESFRVFAARLLPEDGAARWSTMRTRRSSPGDARLRRAHPQTYGFSRGRGLARVRTTPRAWLPSE